MLTIRRETAVYAMSAKNPPAARAGSGDTLVFETADCFGGQIVKETDRMGALDWSRINPATGPVYVEGAEPGDTLKVEILQIALAPQAAMVEAPGEGITGLAATEEMTKILPVRDGAVVFSDRVTLPVCAMIGVIGTAPRRKFLPVRRRPMAAIWTASASVKGRRCICRSTCRAPCWPWAISMR